MFPSYSLKWEIRWWWW